VQIRGVTHVPESRYWLEYWRRKIQYQIFPVPIHSSGSALLQNLNHTMNAIVDDFVTCIDEKIAAMLGNTRFKFVRSDRPDPEGCYDNSP
jgi:hypothetical protein